MADINNLYILARRAKNEGNTDNALKYYSQIVEENPDDPEAYFYSIYYQVSNCKVGEIGTAANRLKAAFNTTVKLLKGNGSISSGNTVELVPYANAAVELASTLSNSANNHYIRNISVSGVHSQTTQWILNSVNVILAVADAFYNLDNKGKAAALYKLASSSSVTHGEANMPDVVIQRIREVEPYYNTGGGSNKSLANEKVIGICAIVVIVMIFIAIIASLL
ncbi:MAG: tetratricopeptide repeat protein [Oscillospiraceae bacterium]|nr:tetratricopeptide repeat protein [Oscillospiraceae bacterium]